MRQYMATAEELVSAEQAPAARFACARKGWTVIKCSRFKPDGAQTKLNTRLVMFFGVYEKNLQEVVTND